MGLLTHTSCHMEVSYDHDMQNDLNDKISPDDQTLLGIEWCGGNGDGMWRLNQQRIFIFMMTD